jgi:hypothetical protein
MFDGRLALFLQDQIRRDLESVEQEIIQNTTNIIKEGMDSGVFKSAHDAIVNLEFIGTNVDAIGNLNENLNDKRRSVPSYAWLLLFAGSVVLTGIVGVAKYKICNREDDSEALSRQDSLDRSRDDSLLTAGGEHQSLSICNTNSLLDDQSSTTLTEASQKIACMTEEEEMICFS